MFYVINGAVIGVVIGWLGGLALGYIDPSGSTDVRVLVGRLSITIGCASGGIIGAVAGLATGSSNMKPLSPIAKIMMIVELIIIGLLVVVAGFITMF